MKVHYLCRPYRWIALGLLLGSNTTHAQFEKDIGDPLTFYATGTFSYDTNLFRIPGPASTELTINEDQRSDTFQVGTVGAKLDKFYKQQEFVGNASYSRYKFQTFDFLDGGATNFDLGWKFHLTPRVSGSVTAARRDAPSNFDFYRGFRQRNFSKQQNFRFRGDFNPFGGWHLIGGGGAFFTSNTVSTGETPKSQRFYGDAGFGYTTPANSQFRAIGRVSSGQYARSNSPIFAAARDFDESEAEFQYFSQPTQITTLKLTAGYVSRKHDNFSDRNYDGWTTDSTIGWSPTAKILVSGRARRELSTFQNQYFTDYAIEEYTLTPKWLATEKISLSSSIGFSRYKFGGFSSLDPEDTESRTDKLGIYSVDATWAPSDVFSIKGSFSNRVRDSSFDPQELDYRNSLTSVTVTLSI